MYLIPIHFNAKFTNKEALSFWCQFKSIINGFCNYYYYYFSILLTFMILLFFFKNDELKEKEKYTSKNFVWKIY